MFIRIDLEIKFRAFLFTFGTTKWSLAIPITGLPAVLPIGQTRENLGSYNKHGVKLIAYVTV